MIFPLSKKLSFDDFSVYFKSTNRDYAWFGVLMHAEQLSCTLSIVLTSILVFNFCLEKDEVILMTVLRMLNLFAAFVKMSQKNLVFAVWETISSTLEFKSTGKVLIIKKYVYVLSVSTMEKKCKALVCKSKFVQIFFNTCLQFTIQQKYKSSVIRRG